MKEVLEYKQIFEDYLKRVSNGLEKGLQSGPMKYVMEGKGKRIRPVLLLSACDALGVDIERALPFACALEIIHCASLVHDDLPCIDNDDLRRGRPTCHVKFGYPFAVLCGDALLNFAYELALENCKDINDINCLKVLATYSGYKGMLGGQFVDVYCEKQDCYDEQTLEYIQLNKTAKLITAPLLMASQLAGGEYYDDFKTYGENIGIAFQMVDDLLDCIGDEYVMGKTLGKDQKSGKMTSVSVYGVEKTKEIVNELTEKAIESAIFDKEDFFVNFAKELAKREM